jgi:uncharacterized protein YoxC
MGILTDSLKELIIQMREHDEKMLKKTNQLLDDMNISIQAMRKLDEEIDSIDSIL